MRIVMALLPLLVISRCVVAQPADENSDQSQRVTDGPVELVVQIDQAEYMVAEPISLRVTLEGPQGTVVTIPRPQETFGPFNVLGVSQTIDLPQEHDASRRRWMMTIELESLEVGRQQIPSLEVAYQLEPKQSQPSTKPQVIRSKPLSVDVISVLSEGETPTAFRDIKGPAEIPEAADDATVSWPWIALGGLAILAVLSAIVYVRRRSSVPPRRWALEEVDQLQSMHRSQSIDGREAMERLSVLVRQYAEAEFDFPATSLSSEELTEELGSRVGCTESSARDGSMRSVGDLLAQADRVKFSADTGWTGVQAESAFDTVRTFVLQASENRDSSDPAEES